MIHKGKRLFITGIPTSGKSYLARKLAKKFGGIAVLLDDFREDLAKDEKYKNFVNFYFNKDELEYYAKASPENQWNDFINQSKGLWPAFLDKINEYKDETKPVFFECVNLLPFIVKNNFDITTVVLVGKSYEETLKRNMEEPRWGKNKELQEIEAKSFFYNERPRYEAEAEKYNCPVFESADEAFDKICSMIDFK